MTNEEYHRQQAALKELRTRFSPSVQMKVYGEDVNTLSRDDLLRVIAMMQQERPMLNSLIDGLHRENESLRFVKNDKIEELFSFVGSNK